MATGRPFTYIDPGLLNLGFDGLVLMNGAVVVIRDKVIFEEPLENSIVKNIVDTCESNEIEYILQGYPKVYLRPEFKLMEKFYSGLEIDISKFERKILIVNYADINKRQMTIRLD